MNDYLKLRGKRVQVVSSALEVEGIFLGLDKSGAINIMVEEVVQYIPIENLISIHEF